MDPISNTKPNPTIVFVPGAWHTPAPYKDMLELLQNAGYPIQSVSLPSVNGKYTERQTLAADVEAVRETLLRVVDQGKEVVLLMHSYGGCAGGAAAKGLSPVQRTGPGAVIGLVFLAAFLVQEGHSLVQTAGGKLDTWVVERGDGQLDVQDTIEVFYHDAPADKASQAASEIQLHSLESFTTPCPPTAWNDAAFDHRRGYIMTRQDRALPYIGQDMMLKLSGVEWVLREMETGHSPFLSNPEELVDHILSIIRSF
ncbi:alpha/beta-hydrolase [Aspergillus heteromorphus CBS 117.55]|uniref:Alpha/beta-hydrolase n=1 Tax=Aspergillus heteromorphus CBS 117.55 TaxID=1448321 RepID=A0A317VIF9_9EURO|nr:alpha/beta-hydrolase [Aspergillus heteromorphus CBS 117.55]PWY73011.1 alpha/beta-hydrolase [Aspergillus heteromorphus CBS 117.55]